MRSGSFLLAALMLAAVATGADAAGPGAVRKQVESSRLVKGTIDIDREGRVAGYAIDQADELPDGIRQMFARLLPHWRFEPVPLPEGKTIARTSMSLRLVARKIDDDSIKVEVAGAQFGEPADGEYVAMDGAPRRPVYPQIAIEHNVSGMVYVALRVGRDGRVVEAMAEQVNLRFIASDNEMGRWRRLLANAALQAARQFRFTTPTRGPHIDAPYWSVRVPFDFRLGAAPPPKVADMRWEAYVPGPRSDIPWHEGEEHESPDAMAGTGLRPLGGSHRLLTPLQPEEG